MQFNFAVDDTPSLRSKPVAAAAAAKAPANQRKPAGSEFEAYDLPQSFKTKNNTNKRKFDRSGAAAADGGDSNTGGSGSGSGSGGGGGRKPFGGGKPSIGAPGGVRIHLEKKRTATGDESENGSGGSGGGADGGSTTTRTTADADALALKKQKIAEARARPLPNVRAPFKPAPITGDQPRPISKELFETGANGAGSGTDGPTGFEVIGISKKLSDNLREHMKMIQPTRIQSNAIPHIMKGSDVMVKSATGSGKTLSYVLPIIHWLDSQPVKIKREDGTKAIIMSPTRELCIQIQTVLTGVLRVCHHIVPGTVMGGEKKKSEKSRIRKGVNVLIATPGRLLDHLQNTAILNVSDLRFLVLDEADRLLDLGFERDVNQIIQLLASKHLAKAPRQNVLVSATLHSGVQRLITLTLREPVVYVGFQENGQALTGAAAAAAVAAIASRDDHSSAKLATDSAATAATADSAAMDDLEVVKADGDGGADSKAGDSGDSEGDDDSKDSKSTKSNDSSAATATTLTKQQKQAAAAEKAAADLAAAAAASHNPLPTTLTQHYIQVNSTQRLTALASFLRWQIFLKRSKKQQLKAVVFLNTCACVEFHWKLFGHSFWPDLSQEDGYKSDDDANAVRPPLLDTVLYKLHGNMLQEDRTKTYHEFCESSGGILFCTDVAARGLDLPSVDWIVQYDPPEELQEYVHRVGRTARMGRRGEALLFLTAGPELGYLQVLQQRHTIGLKPLALPRVLGGLHIVENERSKVSFSKPPALILQQQFERLVVSAELNLHARAAFQTWLRAYTAYPKSLKHIFHHRNLHLGHVARSFGLKEQPSKLGTNLTKELFQKHEKSKLNRSYQEKLASGEIVPGEYKHHNRNTASAQAIGGSELDATTAVVEMDDDGNTTATTLSVKQPILNHTASASAAGGNTKRKPKPLTEEQRKEREIAVSALAALTPSASKKRSAAAAGAEGSGTGSFGKYGKGMVKPKKPLVSAKQQMMKKQAQFVSEFSAF